MKVWYDKYSEKGGDWALVKAEMSVQHEREEGESEEEGWRTQGQILHMHNNDEEVADGIVAEKYAQNQWRPNPDAPKVRKARQFWVRVKSDKHSRRKKKQSVSAQMSAELDQQGAQATVGQLLDSSAPQAARTISPAPSATATASDPAPVPSTVQKLIDKEAARLKKMKDVKQERESKKSDPIQKATRWVTGLDKDLRDIKGTISTMEEDVLQVPRDTCNQFKKKYDGHFQALKTLQDDLRTAVSNQDADKCIELVATGPAKQQGVKDTNRDWRKLCKIQFT